MLHIPIGIARMANDPAVSALLAEYDSRPASHQGSLVTFASGESSDQSLEALKQAAQSVGHKSYTKSIEAILHNRAGRQRSSPSSWSTSEVILAYLNQNIIDGWVYFDDPVMEFTQPMRVIDVAESYNGRLEIRCHILNVSGRSSGDSRIGFEIEDDRGMPSRILEKARLHKETPELKGRYLESAQHAIDLVDSGEGIQCLATGKVMSLRTFQEEWLDRSSMVKLRTSPRDLFDRRSVIESTLEGRPELRDKILDSLDGDSGGLRPTAVPHPPGGDEGNESPRAPLGLFARAFDLAAEAEYVIPTDAMARYVYEPKLRERLVLPETHSRIIDILTQSTDSALSDVVHGKSMGNLILCKGEPGMGKTLTAEVISEVLQRPLYVVDASSIIEPKKRGDYGMESVPLREHLEDIYSRVRRWDAVLLFDEADVVLGKRGEDLARNKITAELLRSLENFERLAFLTTNRPDDVDDAIVSRCVAILEYLPPVGEDAVLAWKSLGRLIGEDAVTDDMARELVGEFPSIPPRDIKQMLNLARRVADKESRPVDVDLIRELAVFRSHTPESMKGKK